MRTFAAIIGLWPSLRAFAGDLGVPYVNAQMMKYRDSIPPEHWPRLLRAAEERGIGGLSLQLLVRLRARKARRPKPKRKAASLQEVLLP